GPGSPARSGFRQPTRPGTPGNRSSLAIRTTCPTGNGSCTSSPTASNGKPPSTSPAAEQPRPIFRQLAEQHDDREPESHWKLRRGGCISTPWVTATPAD